MSDERTPDHCMVFDLETVGAANYLEISGIGDTVDKIVDMEFQDLMRYCEEHEIKLGPRKNEKVIREYAIEYQQKKVAKAALFSYGLEIYAIGVADLFEGKVKVWTTNETHTEKDVVKAFYNHLMERPVVLATFNGREWDLPVVRARMAVHGCGQLPWYFPETKTEDRYNKTTIFDVRDYLLDGKLDTWLRVFGLPPKTGRGDKVAEMTPKEVQAYCGDDVERTRLLIHKLKVRRFINMEARR